MWLFCIDRYWEAGVEKITSCKKRTNVLLYGREDNIRNKAVVEVVAVLDETPLHGKAMRFKKIA